MKNSTEAVSPVVGVMLMLVVTIIIAAVVSAFAGGVGGSQQKTPQATISATYSQSGGMTISHNGGDVLGTTDTNIFVHPSRSFGTYDNMGWSINKSVILNQATNKYWQGSSREKAFSPGDTVYISKDNLIYVQEKADGSGGNDASSSGYGFLHSNAIGKVMIVELIDVNTGKPITRTETVITS